ncbi:MAG TPA: hypothetical protein VEH58_06280, partial [Dehalococcoidales bacterium]|nr:hypothetical protein [Dehalococcoidales bacterium]
EGLVIAWQAGAEFTKMEQSYTDSGAFSYLEYGMGNSHNTWYGTPIIDANGKEVPYYDRDGKEIIAESGRFMPPSGQHMMLGHGERVPENYENQTPALSPDLAERIKKGEFVLPLYADLTRMSRLERRAIFGLMVGNEGKTRIPVYQQLTGAGFNPDKDMLQVPVMPPEGYQGSNFWAGVDVPHWRIWGGGGLIVDWDLKTNIDGLYAAGGAIFGAGAHSGAAASGRYVGRTASAAAKIAPEPEIDRSQVEIEKARVYAPLQHQKHPIGWKEMNAGICRVMQDYCGQYRSENTLQQGIDLLTEIRETEADRMYANTPHELGRILECYSLMTLGVMAMESSLARKSSSRYLNLNRLDFPAVDPPPWQKLLPIRQENGRTVIRDLDFNYHLLPPFAPTYAENYKQHCGMTP